MLKKVLTTLALILTANTALAAERLELNFFADQQQFEMQERKKLVKFLKDHEPGDVYEFELLSLLDPLKIGLDDRRLKDIQAVFRQYGVNIDGLLSAKIKFIASEEQKFVVIRKSK